MEKLASELLLLPLDINEKIFLWLTYKGLKPVSEIEVIRRENKESNPALVEKWIEDAGLIYLSYPDSPYNWHVGKELKKIEKTIENLHKFTYESEIVTGELFGFPSASVKAYADNRVGKKTPIIWVGEKYINEITSGHYFTPYILYSVSRENVEKDILVAKEWADTIRNDVPKLAQQFEKEQEGEKEIQLKLGKVF